MAWRLVLLIASLILSMNSATADGGRVLYGIARDDMTIKQLHHLNRFHVPARAMAVDMVVNILLILFVANNLAILYMSNIGYIFAHVLALSGFLLLRRDRPNWPRPIKVGPAWLVVAWVLCLANLVFLIWGVTQRDLAATLGGLHDERRPRSSSGSASWSRSVLLFFYRRAVQDKKKITFRDDDVPDMPNAEQMRLLHEEEVPPRVRAVHCRDLEDRAGAAAPARRCRVPPSARDAITMGRVGSPDARRPVEVRRCPRRCGDPSRSGASATNGTPTGSTPIARRSCAQR